MNNALIKKQENTVKFRPRFLLVNSAMSPQDSNAQPVPSPDHTLFKTNKHMGVQVHLLLLQCGHCMVTLVLHCALF